MKCGSVLFAATVVAATLLPRHAQAFEREWHLGGGVGLTAYPHDYSAGPALGINAAYGISDVFDLKLELLGSYHGYSPSPKVPTEHAQPYSAIVGLSYKLDVLQWVPYGALLVGYQHIGGALPLGEPFRRDDILGSFVLGLDYEVTREFGLGASLRTDIRLSSPSNGEAFTPMLRAEYHWGF
ncbi:MAG: outer membrane beta-barrel protein [Polyangiaceae bacterium]